MANGARVGSDLSLEEVLDGWPKKARHCFESLRKAVSIDGSEWSGIISAFGRTPVPILSIGDKNLCQVHPEDDRVVMRMIRGEDLLEAVNKDRKLPARAKRAFSKLGKINFLAEVPVAGVGDARAASSILAIKAASLDGRSSPPVSPKRAGRKAAERRKSV